MSGNRGKGQISWTRHLISLGIFVFLVLADQISKFYIVKNIPLGFREVIIPGWLNFTHTENPGGAFSIFAEHPNLFLVVSSLAAIILVIIYVKMAREKWSGIFAVIILSGAIGNMIDRFRFGQVVDFVDFYFNDWHWYIFNVADAAITVGAIGLFVITLFAEIKSSRAAKTGENGDVPVTESAVEERDG